MVAITTLVATSGERLRVKAGVVCLQCESCVIHTWALQRRVSHYWALYKCPSFLQDAEQKVRKLLICTAHCRNTPNNNNNNNNKQTFQNAKLTLKSHTGARGGYNQKHANRQTKKSSATVRSAAVRCLGLAGWRAGRWKCPRVTVCVRGTYSILMHCI